MLDKLGGRKFVGFVIVVALLFMLVLTKYITGQDFVSFVTANLAIYTAGNVVSSFSADSTK